MISEIELQISRNDLEISKNRHGIIDVCKCISEISNSILISLLKRLVIRGADLGPIQTYNTKCQESECQYFREFQSSELMVVYSTINIHNKKHNSIP